MERHATRISWPALGLATAMALVVTTGVPALMQAGNPIAPHVDAIAASSRGAATEVAIEPQRIDVVGTRERATVSRWFSTVSLKRPS